MKFFERKAGATLVETVTDKPLGELRFLSTAALERGLDGGEDRFARYFFAIYHCSPDEPSGISDLREQLKLKYPSKAAPVGQRFVLLGEAAFTALAAYYQALSEAESLSDEYRAHSKERLAEITELHQNSQSLPVPVDMTEGQLAQDKRLEFLTCLALRNGQVVSSLD